MTIAKHLLPLTSFLLLLFSSPTDVHASINYYVTPTGNDQASGSITEPFATLHKAQAVVRSRINEGLTDKINILIRGGVYQLNSPLQFTPLDSGTTDHPISYLGYPGEQVVLSAGLPISNWTVNNNLWQTQLPALNSTNRLQLFVNNQLVPVARTNVNNWTIESYGYSTPTPLNLSEPGKVVVVSESIFSEKRCPLNHTDGN